MDQLNKMRTEEALALVFIAAISGQGVVYAQDLPKAVFLHGKVIDDNGMLLEGAVIELVDKKSGTRIDSFVTGFDGLYIVKKNFEGAEGAAEILIIVTKKGYATYTEEMMAEGNAPPMIIDRDIILTGVEEEKTQKTSVQEDGEQSEIVATQTPPATILVSNISSPQPQSLEETPIAQANESIEDSTNIEPQPEVFSETVKTEEASAPETVKKEDGVEVSNPIEEGEVEKKGLLEKIIEFIRGFFKRIIT